MENNNENKMARAPYENKPLWQRAEELKNREEELLKLLYDPEFQTLSPEELEQKQAEALDAFFSAQGSLVEKFVNCTKMRALLLDYQEHYAQQAKALAAKAQQAKRDADRLEASILKHMGEAGIKKIEEETVKLYYKQTEVVDMLTEDPNSIPDEYRRIKVMPDKRALKKAIKDGNAEAIKVARIVKKPFLTTEIYDV